MLDASAVFARLLGTHDLSEHIERDGPDAAPHLVDAEVGHALRRAVRERAATEGRARAALADLADMPLVRVGHSGLIRRAWELRENLSFYDGLYVALAEGLDVPLVTLDARLAGATGPRCAIELAG